MNNSWIPFSTLSLDPGGTNAGSPGYFSFNASFSDIVHVVHL